MAAIAANTAAFLSSPLSKPNNSASLGGIPGIGGISARPLPISPETTLVPAPSSDIRPPLRVLEVSEVSEVSDLPQPVTLRTSTPAIIR